MDETVYQCPECNFNTDNLNNLNKHIVEEHENENDDFNDSSNSQRQQQYDDDDIDDENGLIEDYYNSNAANHDSEDEVEKTETVSTTTTTTTRTILSRELHQPQQQHSSPTKQIPNTDNHYERQYSCKYCSFYTNNPRAILYHRKNTHNEKIPIYECAHCQYASQYSGKVERHTLLRHKINIGNGTTNGQTPDNDAEFDSSTTNSAIIMNGTSGSSGNSQTPPATTTTTTSSTVDNSPATTLAFQCTKCPCKYKRSNDLYKHIRLKHSGLIENSNNNNNQPPSSIADDGNSNSSFNNITNNNHLNESPPTPINNNNNNTSESETNGNGNSSSGKLECPYCTYTSVVSSDYLSHIKEHLGGKTFRCILCNAIYKYRGDCVVHLKRKHQKADLLAQNYVQRIDVDTINLHTVYSLLKPKMYDDIDNEDKLFGCCYCDYKANYKGDVYKHQTRRHPGTMKNARALNTAASSTGDYSFDQQTLQQQQNNQQDYNDEYNDDDDENGAIVDDENDGRATNNTANNTASTTGITRYHNNYQQQYTDDYDDDYDSLDETTPAGHHNDIEENNYGHHTDDDDDDDDDNNSHYNDSMMDYHHQQQHQQLENGNGSSDLYLYECKLCPYKAKNSAKLQFHMSTHDNLKQYMCPICKKRANFKWDIQKHLRKVHNNTTDEVVCLSPNEAKQTIDQYIEYYGNGANSNVKKFNQLQHHQQQLNDDDELSSPQPYQSQPTQPHQQQNNNNNNNNNPPLLLNPNIFLSKHSTRERKYKCSLCNRTSKWQWDIRKHMRTVHKEQTGDVVVLSDKDLIKKLTENPSYSRTLALMNNNNGNGNTSESDHHHSPTPPSPPHHQSLLVAPVQIPHQTSLHSNYVSIGSDSTGNKKFKCTICPYRSNWKADLFRHIRKRHSINQPSIDDVIILTPEEAASSITDYETTHGIYIRKRSRIDLDTSGTTNSNNSHSFTIPSSVENQHQFYNSPFNSPQKQQRVLLPSNENQQQQYEYNNDESMNGMDKATDEPMPSSMPTHQPASTTILVKSFQCLKCTYKTIRKSDLLRHLKVRHSLYTNLNRYFKTLTTTNIQQKQPSSTSNGAIINSSSSHLPNTSGNSGHGPSIIFHKNFYKCTYCLFKHINKAMVKKHLMTHQLKTNGFKCNICSYKSEWRYSVKKHIISTHWLVPNAAVVKCALKPSRVNNENDHQNQAQQEENNNNNNNNNTNNENGFNIKSELMDTHEHQHHPNENEINSVNSSFSSAVQAIKTESHNSSFADSVAAATEIQQQIAAVKPSSFESSKLITPNGKSYTSAFVTVTPNGTVVDDPNDVNYANCTKKKMYFCESCPYKTNNYCNLKQHLLQHRPEAGHAKCRYCPYYVSMSRLLKQHEVLHPEYIPRERDLNNLSLNTTMDHQQQDVSPKQRSSHDLNASNNSSAVEIVDDESDTEMNTYQQPKPQQQQQQQQLNVNNSVTKKTAVVSSPVQQQPAGRIYRCKYCSFTSTDTNDAKVHARTHMLEQEKADAALKYKNKMSSVSSASSSSSTSPSPSPLSTTNLSNNFINPFTSKLTPQQQLQRVPAFNNFDQQSIPCPFCDHVAKNSFGWNQHLMYHLTTNTMPKNLFGEAQLRQILSIQANNPLSYAIPHGAALAAAAAAFQGLTTPFPPPLAIPKQQQQPQQKHQVASQNTSSSPQPQKSKSSKQIFNGNRANSSEYIDISEYEKFVAVLEEAVDEQ